MNERFEKTAILSMCMGLEEYIENAQKLKRGRLKRQIAILADRATKHILELPRLYSYEAKMLAGNIDRFDIKVGWKGKSNHILLYCNFLAKCIEKYKYHDLNEPIMNIMDYFERTGSEPGGSFDDGLKAFNVWENML